MKPIWPRDKEAYKQAFAEAETMYKEWLESRKDQAGLTLFAVRRKTEISYADISGEGNEG